MNKLFRLVKRGKALTHIVTGKREAILSEQVVLGAEPVQRISNGIWLTISLK